MQESDSRYIIILDQSFDLIPRQDEGIDLLSQLASESEIRGVELNLSSYYKIDLSNRLQMQLHYAIQPTQT